MVKIICPNCKGYMEEIVEPDIKIDRCPKCEAIFLDKEELNILATGMAGDIEYCSIDDKYHKDNYPMRLCPRCIDQTMKKINLLQFTDIIFDYCPRCEGFFLDKDELEDVNEKLQEIHGSRFKQEYRGYKNNHLVRIDVYSDVKFISVLGGAFTRPAGVNYLQITVYFIKPLNIELRIFDEVLLAKIAKAFRIYKGQDIIIGDSNFDSKFIIQSNDENKIKIVLTNRVREAILGFISKKPKLFSQVGRLEIFDNRMVYIEGPYTGEIDIPPDKAFEIIINNLLQIADEI